MYAPLWNRDNRPLTGSDAFCVPSLRHFDTGAPYHPSCCTGETLLRTWRPFVQQTNHHRLDRFKGNDITHHCKTNLDVQLSALPMTTLRIVTTIHKLNEIQTGWYFQYEDGTTGEEDGSVASSWREFSWCGKTSEKAIEWDGDWRTLLPCFLYAEQILRKTIEGIGFVELEQFPLFPPIFSVS